MLVQASESLVARPARKREIAAPSEAMAELGMSSVTIVTRGEQERIDIRGGFG
jgi:hypothetical protein